MHLIHCHTLTCSGRFFSQASPLTVRGCSPRISPSWGIESLQSLAHPPSLRPDKAVLWYKCVRDLGLTYVCFFVGGSISGISQGCRLINTFFLLMILSSYSVPSIFPYQFHKGPELQSKILPWKNNKNFRPIFVMHIYMQKYSMKTFSWTEFMNTLNHHPSCSIRTHHRTARMFQFTKIPSI